MVAQQQRTTQGFVYWACRCALDRTELLPTDDRRHWKHYASTLGGQPPATTTDVGLGPVVVATCFIAVWCGASLSKRTASGLQRMDSHGTARLVLNASPLIHVCCYCSPLSPVKAVGCGIAWRGLSWSTSPRGDCSRAQLAVLVNLLGGSCSPRWCIVARKAATPHLLTEFA